MNIPRYFKFLIASALFLGAAAAGANTPLESTFSVLEEPAESPIWLRLLHVDKNNDGKSMVRDKAFFLAVDGAHNPAAELRADALAFWSDDPAQRALRCRFPARYRWLSAVLNRSDQAGLSSCEEYLQWRDRMPAGKLVLIFPSYQLNSPSSMFGHTLLRLDPENTEEHATWLSQAVNFGAVQTEKDNSAAYAFKGITGAYTGSFAVMPYFHKIQEYGHFENRDIWEYALDFSAAETEWLVTHLWELRGIEFGYYFFDQNCSYRLLELLEVARPTLSLTPVFDTTAIPIDTIRELDRQQLIESRHFRPSQERQLHNTLAKVPTPLRPWMSVLRDDPAQAQSAAFLDLDESSRAHLLHAALGYTRFKDTRGDRGRARNRMQLLREIKALPQAMREQLVDTGAIPVAPEQGHDSRRVQLSYQDDTRSGESLLLSARMAFHSLSDNNPGYLSGAQINMLDLQLRHRDRKTRIERFELIDIASLVPSKPYFPHTAWKVKLGLAPLRFEGSNKLGAKLSGGVGYSREIGANTALYGLLDVHTEFDHRELKLRAAAGPRVGLLSHAGPFTLLLEGYKQFSRHGDQQKIHATLNTRLQKNTSIALSSERIKTEDATWQDSHSLSLRFFFR